jgi:ligand-binding SRPBCC domain-containing protein
MVDVSTTITIDSPLQSVAEFSSNPDNATKWYVNIKSVVWKTQKPAVVGSQIDFVAHFMGRKLAYTYEVVEKSSTRFVMRTSQGPFPMETTYEWQDMGNQSTRMTLRNRGNPTGFSKLFAPFMSMMMRMANKKDLKMLKEILEAKAVNTERAT